MSRYNIIVPSKEKIEELYCQEGATISSVARLLETNNTTLRKWLIGYDIDRKSHQQASKEANNRHRSSIIPEKAVLERMYSENSIKNIETFYSVSQQTVYEWLDFLEIPLKTLSEATTYGKLKQYEHIKFTKEFLEEQYDKTKPLSFLCDKLNVSNSHIRNLFKKYGIEAAIPWRSKAEIDLFDYCKETFPDCEWESSNRSLITPFELDIVNHTLKIAIEYCGVYWHSEFLGGKENNYHQKKFLLCRDAGYKLVTVFESDNIEKIKSLLNTIHSKNEKIYARNTEIKELTVEVAREFYDKHHIHNFVGAKHHYGLFHNNVLVQAISFGVSRYNGKYEFECTRMVSHSDYTVIGGASKLFSHFFKTVNPKNCVTYSDLRFGEGKVYENCGFSYRSITSPNYWYFNRYDIELFSRVKFQKHKLPDMLEIFDSNLSEFENMTNNRWDRIWDCGNAVYVWENKKRES